MNLATRCPSCGTVFRVVRDQLKVSDGWVRCGRCAEVFNAAKALFELEADGAAAATQTDAPRARTEAGFGDEAPGPPVASAEPDAEPTPRAERASAMPAEPTGPAPALADAPAATLSRPAAASTVAQTDVLADAMADAMAGVVTAEADSAPAATPDFIRRADAAAQRSSSKHRGLLALLALLLLALLAAQIGLHYRDPIAAAWPPSRPALLAVCRLLGCEVEAPRRIDSLHVDSSGLVRLHGSALYRLSLVVRNKAATPVRMPAVELALTDSQGQTTARRVFSAAELGQTARSLAAGAELALQATLDLGEQREAGYTVELFYP